MQVRAHKLSHEAVVDGSAACETLYCILHPSSYDDDWILEAAGRERKHSHCSGLTANADASFLPFI